MTVIKQLFNFLKKTGYIIYNPFDQITNKVPFDRRRMEDLASLKYIGVTATGYNIIDIEAARELGIAVTNIPSYSTDAVAQHVFAFILEVSNAVALHDKSVKEGQWERSDTFCYWKTPLFELAGKRLGIVGLGNIGRRVASIAKAFAMDVVSYSPHSRMEGVKAVDLDTLMSARCVVAVAGMEGALASVIGGLVDCPVIAVPTSVGYGASFGGLSALLSMLNSCASGCSVVNIDNGFGAGFLASRINQMEGLEEH